MLLHFGAVDYACAVQVNGHLVGGHRGGYWPFTLDITAQLNGTGRNSLWVAVQDPSGTATQARGKQTLKPGGMFRFKTDNDVLFDYSRETIAESPFTVTFVTEDLHHSERAETNIMTEYERNFSEKGVQIKSIEARKPF